MALYYAANINGVDALSLQETTMRYEQAIAEDAIRRETAQQLHRRAAQLHELARMHHNAAAEFLASGDFKAAGHHAQLANGHLVQAGEQGAAASRKLALDMAKALKR